MIASCTGVRFAISCGSGASSRARSRRSSIDAAVLGAERTGADPHQLAGGAELVEHARVIVEDARGQDPLLELGERQRDALEPLDRVAQRERAAARLIEAVPARQERGVRSRRRPARPARAASRACGGAAGAGPPDRS